DAGRDDAAVLVDEVLQDLDILVVDFLDAFRGEAAELATPEQRPVAAVLLVLALLRASESCHVTNPRSVQIRSDAIPAASTCGCAAPGSLRSGSCGPVAPG